MGGNALKAINPSRLSSDGVLHLFNKVEWVANMLGDNARLVPWTSDKTSHGDVDIVVSNRYGDGCDIDGYKRMLKVLSDPRHTKPNGPVTSIAVEVPVQYTVNPTGQGPFFAQVDLIQVHESDVPFAKLYFSGDGIGMLIGRVAASYGYVFASDGLRIRADSTVPWSKDIEICKDPQAVLEFLGYDPALGGGFESEEHVWNYAMSSHWARPWMFLSANTNAENRSRDKQRPSFTRFQEWLQDKYTTYELTPPATGDSKTQKFEECLDQASTYFQRDFWVCVYQDKYAFDNAKKFNRFWGLDAVRSVITDPSKTDEELGGIVGAMQQYLPPKSDRERIYEIDQSLASVVAKTAAKLAILDKGNTLNG